MRSVVRRSHGSLAKDRTTPATTGMAGSPMTIRMYAKSCAVRCTSLPKKKDAYTGVYSGNKMRLIQLQVSVSTYCYHPGSNGPGSEKPWIDSTFA